MEPTAERPRPTADEAPERVPVEAILRGRHEVILQHRNEEYRLRITSNGKLLLTK